MKAIDSNFENGYYAEEPEDIIRYVGDCLNLSMQVSLSIYEESVIECKLFYNPVQKNGGTLGKYEDG